MPRGGHDEFKGGLDDLYTDLLWGSLILYSCLYGGLLILYQKK